MEPDTFSVLDMLATLEKYQVDYIIVGGICGVLHGAAISTFDLDVVPAQNEENIQALLQALKELDASYRTHPDQKIFPKAEHLMTKGHHLLITKYGPLDVLGSIGHGHRYGDLISKTETVQVQERNISILTLKALIDIKKETLFEKDKYIISVLEQLKKTDDEKMSKW